MFFIVPLGHLHIISSKSIHNFMSNVIYKQTDRQTFTAKNTTSFIHLFVLLKLNDNKHSRFCKVTHTRDFHGLQLVLYINTLSWGSCHTSVGYSLRPTRTSSLSMDAVCLSHCYKVLSDRIW